MDQTPQLLESKKNEFQTKLLNFLMPQVKEGTLKFEDFQDIAADILQLMDGVEVEGQFFASLYVLSEKWAVLKPLYEKEKVGELAHYDVDVKDDKIDAVRSKLLQLTQTN